MKKKQRKSYLYTRVSTTMQGTRNEMHVVKQSELESDITVESICLLVRQP